MPRRKQGLGFVVRDTAYITSKLPWWAALIFGVLSFVILYFAVPSWLSGYLKGHDGGYLKPVFEVICSKHINKFQWAGIACGIVGLYFTIRNYLVYQEAGKSERSIIGVLAKLISRKID